MNEINIVNSIKEKDFDKQYFVDLVIENEIARDIIINNLLTNEHIMVYYHCYYVIDIASKARPELFYDYYFDFAKLLSHSNSYHRDIALTILANLIFVDTEHKLDTVFEQYLALVKDKKFMTGNSCVKNLARIVKVRTDLIERVMSILLALELTTNYTSKQFELLKYDILNIICLVYSNYKDKQILKNYIEESTHSISPKTRKRAKELLKKYCY